MKSEGERNARSLWSEINIVVGHIDRPDNVGASEGESTDHHQPSGDSAVFAFLLIASASRISPFSPEPVIVTPGNLL